MRVQQTAEAEATNNRPGLNRNLGLEGNDLMTDTTEQTRAQQDFAKLLASYQAEQHRMAVEAQTDEQIDASSDRLCYLERRFWQTPAPDLRAVLIKFEVANLGTDMPPPDATASILADLRRLSGEAVSPLFQADLWLIEWESFGGSYVVRDGEALICGNPTSKQHKRLMRNLAEANGAQAVKAMIIQCDKSLEVEPAE